MIVKFNPTGTHIHKGFLKVRLDFYPEPTDKTHALHYVDKPDTPYLPSPKEVSAGISDPVRYAAWWATVPKHKELNPCLCHFVKVDAGITSGELEALEQGLGAIADELDDALMEPANDIRLKRIRQITGAHLGAGKPVGDLDVTQINARLEVRSGD